ncbi:MAG TPA: Rid family hydrolase [Candidatus Acidoferrales bacterium]|nr:Rid family hydrolase [Candidatus Acidoferrales bacterium]
MRRFLIALLVASSIAGPACAQSTGRTYLTSPVAARNHLPFSSGVLVGNVLYIAGTTGVSPGMKNTFTLTQEARAVMDNVKRVVERAGMTMDDVVSVQVFCTNLSDYGAFNRVYATYFRKNYPARAFIGASNLLFGARYEVTGIAVRPQP